MIGRAAATLAGAALLAGCGAQDELPGEPAASPSPGTTASPAVTRTETGAVGVDVTREITYHSGNEAWIPPLVDVYAPSGATDLPVVVMFHDGFGRDVDKWSLLRLARATAEQGAVVFTPNWGAFERSADPVIAQDDGVRQLDAAACAVRFALELAEEFGGDPDRLVLAGHAAGANVALAVALREPAPFPECGASAVPVDPAGVALLEGSWLLTDPTFDAFGDATARATQWLAPWAWIRESDARPDVLLLATDTGPSTQRRCEITPGEGWLASRDPDGALTDALDQAGALDDGCVDIGEEADLLREWLADDGFAAARVTLPRSGHVLPLSPDDGALAAEAIVGLAEAR